MIPRPYQLKAIDFLIKHRKSFNLSEPRTGKTATSIWAIQRLQTVKPDLRVLIVAPKSTVNFTWHAELDKLGCDKTHITLINFAWLHRVEGPFDMIVVDEFTFLKNPTSIRSKAFIKLAKGAMFITALSGTPIAQSAMDTYVSLGAINPTSITDRKGRMHSYRAVKARLYSEPYPNKWVPRADLPQIMHKLLTPAFRVTMKDAGIDTGDIHTEDVHVPLGPKQQAALARLKYDCTLAIEEKSYEEVHLNRAVWVNKAIQICNGFIYTEIGVQDLDGPKYEAVEALIEQHSKVIVFSAYTHALNRLHARLPGSKVVCGSTTDRQRREAFDAFQTGDLNVLIMNPRSCSHGLTLSTGNCIIWMEPAPSEIFYQANCRITRPVTDVRQCIYKLSSDKLDAKGYQVAESKSKLQDVLFDLVAS